jgi:hypothetical protein
VLARVLSGSGSSTRRTPGESQGDGRTRDGHSFRDGTERENLEEESPRGERTGGSGKTGSSVADSRTEQSPEGGASGDGADGQLSVVERRQRREGRRAGDEPVRLCGRNKPLKGEPWTWLRGEINLQGLEWVKPSRACETPRADGRRGWIPVVSTPGTDAAKREPRTPREVLRPKGSGAGFEAEVLCRGVKSTRG